LGAAAADVVAYQLNTRAEHLSPHEPGEDESENNAPAHEAQYGATRAISLKSRQKRWLRITHGHGQAGGTLNERFHRLRFDKHFHCHGKLPINASMYHQFWAALEFSDNPDPETHGSGPSNVRQ
jgi:hypothetical protein